MHRIEHGLRWGAVASVAGGIVALVLVALRLWPPGHPLSVLVVQMVGRDYLDHQGGVGLTWLVAGVLQVTWGALWGGLLAVVTDRVTPSNALGLGALRWLWTQIMVAPALGWGDFGFLHMPLLPLVTVLPHAAYTVCLGWLMRQEDEGHVPIPIHLHWHRRSAHVRAR
jgi:hypothetical protein